jgi:hypothetical protein
MGKILRRITRFENCNFATGRPQEIVATKAVTGDVITIEDLTVVVAKLASQQDED